MDHRLRFCIGEDSRRVASSFIAWCALVVAAQATEPFFEKSVLFEEQTDGFTLYRIPGIVVTAKDVVLAYCEARKLSVADRGEIEIHLRRSTDGGKTFSPPVQVAHLGPRLPRNSVLPPGKKAKTWAVPVNRR